MAAGDLPIRPPRGVAPEDFLEQFQRGSAGATATPEAIAGNLERGTASRVLPQTGVAAAGPNTAVVSTGRAGTLGQLQGALANGQITPEEFAMRSQQIAQPAAAVAPRAAPGTLAHLTNALKNGSITPEEFAMRAPQITGEMPAVSRLAAVASSGGGPGALPGLAGEGAVIGRAATAKAAGTAVAETAGGRMLMNAAPIAAKAGSAEAAALLTQGAAVTNAAGGGTVAGAIAEGGAAAGVSRFAALGLSRPTLMTLGKASIPLTVGLIASGMVDSMNVGGEDSFLDEILPGGILGGATGMAVVTALGASGPVGWGIIGAGIAIGAGIKLLSASGDGGRDDLLTDTRGVIQTVSGAAGLHDRTVTKLQQEFDTQTAIFTALGDDKGLETFLTNFGTSLPQIMTAARQQQDLEDKEIDRYNRQLSLQANFAPMFAEQTRRASQSSQIAASMANESAGRLESTSPQLASLIRLQGAQSDASAQSLYAAYSRQLATTPPPAQTIEDVQQGQGQLAAQDLVNQYMTQPVAP